MKRIAYGIAGFVAVVLIPALLYFSLRHSDQGLSVDAALWAPIVVLAADALIFYIALGIWALTAWERVGISVILPMLIAILSWAAMMNMVSADMAQAGDVTVAPQP